MKLSSYFKRLFKNEERLVSPCNENKLSKDQENLFCRNGLSKFQYNIVDNSCSTVQEEMNSLFSLTTINEYRELIRMGKTSYYGKTDKWLYKALNSFPISGESSVIFGSANPWYEAVSLEYGVGNCYVIEYSPRPTFSDKIIYMNPSDQHEIKYDSGISISSFEHDGLGRYGDPLNPDGDLEAMDNAKKIIKKDGLLYLSIPIGKDMICFNTHRIYGKNRLPLLLKGWRIEKSFGFSDKDLNNTKNSASFTPYQPVFVLRNL